jgi:hypothetical protein
MKNKWLFSLFITAIAVVTILGTSTMAYAKPPDAETDYQCECETECTAAQSEAEPEPTPTPPPQTLTPQGNLTLVDDFEGELAQDKQFITVITRNGHFFYIVIDRAGERHNVHFLNQVDEYDLWAILNEEAPRPAPTVPDPPTPVPEPDTNPDVDTEPEQEEQNSGAGGLILMILLVGAIGGGAFYYFKIMKPKQGNVKAAISELDEFNFDEDEYDDLDGGETTIMEASDFEDNIDEDIPDFTFESAETRESEDE